MAEKNKTLAPLNIVANSHMLRRFKTIDIFRLDLGNKRLYDDGIKVSDTFIITYHRLHNRLIHKYGDIGSLRFYEDFFIKQDTFIIYKGNDVYEVEYSTEDKQKPIKDFLSDIVYKINTKDFQSVSHSTAEGIVATEEDINKLEGGIPRPRIDLPKEQYIQEMIKRRQALTS